VNWLDLFVSERDAFDTLFDHAPDKLSIVKRSLIEFANRHLEKVNLTVTDLDTQVNEIVECRRLAKR